MLISSILSPILPGDGAGTTNPPASGNPPAVDTEHNEAGSDSGTKAKDGTSSGNTAPGASAHASAGGKSASNAHDAAGSSGAVSRKPGYGQAAADADLAKMQAERMREMLLQASMIDRLMQASDEESASMMLFEREQSAAEPLQQVAAGYGEF